MVCVIPNVGLMRLSALSHFNIMPKKERTMHQKLNIIINGKTAEGYAGETILDVTKRHHIDIPTLCHDPRLKPYSSCFVCVVEVEDARTLQPACSTTIFEGMKIHTHTEKVRKARKTALDLLVSNHFADCVAPCKETCPAGVDVQGYISLIEKALYKEAIGLIKQTNPLPAVCGRVCVRPCEAACRRNFLDEGSGVGIDYLKRFAADKDLFEGHDHYVPEVYPSTGKKVAIIGAGPGGLSSAYFLQQKGHQCDIYEAAPKPGGWLRYGIPEYRLPNEVLDKEIQTITELGVQIYCRNKLGDNLTYPDLQHQYNAVILTIGSQKGTSLSAEGEDAENVLSGIEFLRNMALTGKQPDFTGKTVGVVGGGNTAMDCCRTARRCGAEKVYVIYRRAEEQMPANPIEIHESKREGIEYLLLTNPVKVNKDQNGKLKSLTLIKMELGEADASGRRRPIPIDGSEFEMELDYLLTAIGQKTEVDFVNHINQHEVKGHLELNRWGDISADTNTLQTGIDHIFAAGDGVTGPATIIEAIAQAQIASESCHRYLSGKSLQVKRQEFISRKDHFRTLAREDFAERYKQQFREEMPTVSPKERMNFQEVELGYPDAHKADKETGRCMECGCSEYYTCDLKRYATEYESSQERFKGDFMEYSVDFSHPFIEIDNNKCILCARCIRICHEVVGANALGLVNRGFETYMAPSMEVSLTQTNCESCGLCISACPTGAITENTPFKPAPVEWKTLKTLCNYCSVGCEINIHHIGGFVHRVTGSHGDVNTDANLCKYPKFGYHYINDSNRLNTPLLKINGSFEPISFDQAYEIILEKIRHSNPHSTAFYAGSRLSNEELYLIQKFARIGVGTNNINSFYYLTAFERNKLNTRLQVSFRGLSEASRIYLLGSELNNENGVVGFMVNQASITRDIPVDQITVREVSSMRYKVDHQIGVNSYYHFVKAVNHYMLSHDLQHDDFIKTQTKDFESYKTGLLKENFDLLIEQAGVLKEQIIDFAETYIKENNPVLLFAERNVSPSTASEIQHLILITEKIPEAGGGIIALKEKNNAQGIIDMGIHPTSGPGNRSLKDTSFLDELKTTWNVDALPGISEKEHLNMLDEGLLTTMFVFGEDPVGCAINKQRIGKWFDDADFVMVQDYFLTETAEKASLVLPATLPVESSGSFTNTQRNIQGFDKQVDSCIEKENYRQLLDLLSLVEKHDLHSLEEVRDESGYFLPGEDFDTYVFQYTRDDSVDFRLFDHGCDIVVKYFDDQFNNAFSYNKSITNAQTYERIQNS